MYYRRRWPWIGQQTWNDVVFLHWPVQAENLRPHIPAPFEIELYENKAWISVVFFKAKHSRLRSFSPSLSYPVFDQLNVRTYVKFGTEPGVHFFTLHANNPLIVKGAKFLSLPYVEAEIHHHANCNDQQKLMTSNRVNMSASLASFSAHYTPGNRPFIAEKGSLTNWLTERYCIWLLSGQRIMKAPLSHLPWVLYDVDVNVNMMNGVLPINEDLEKKPVTHYARSMTAYVHPYERFGIYSSD